MKGKSLYVIAVRFVGGRRIDVSIETKIGESKEQFLAEAMVIMENAANPTFLELMSKSWDSAMEMVDKMRTESLIGSVMKDAAMAMQGMLAQVDDKASPKTWDSAPEGAARASVRCADALLAELAKPQEPTP